MQPERRVLSNNQLTNSQAVQNNNFNAVRPNTINPFAQTTNQQNTITQTTQGNVGVGNTHVDVKVTENDNDTSLTDDSDLSDSDFDMDDVNDHMNRVDLKAKDSYFLNKPEFNTQSTVNTNNFNAQSTLVNTNFNADPNVYNYNNPNAYVGSSRNLNNENIKVEVKIDEQNRGINNYNGFVEARSLHGSDNRLNTAYERSSCSQLNQNIQPNTINMNRPNTAIVNNVNNELRGSRNNLNFNQTVRRQSSLNSLNNSLMSRPSGYYDQRINNPNNLNQTSDSDVRRAVTLNNSQRIMTNPTVTTLRAGSNLNNY
jgi:hypothetical protein